MNDREAMIRHFLAALAYRTQKAVRAAPDDFGEFQAGNLTRTPKELVQHMTSVLGYACTLFAAGRYRPEPLLTLDEEVQRFHRMLEALAGDLDQPEPAGGVTLEQLLQGPLSDAMTHAGQLAMLRRLHGSPVPPENFVFAEIESSNLGEDQPLPRMPDPEWPERL